MLQRHLCELLVFFELRGVEAFVLALVVLLNLPLAHPAFQCEGQSALQLHTVRAQELLSLTSCRMHAQDAGCGPHLPSSPISSSGSTVARFSRSTVTHSSSLRLSAAFAAGHEHPLNAKSSNAAG